MAKLDPSRKSDEALAWAERQVGGRIIRKELQVRWRPVWSLDIEKPNGEVVPLLLRGYRGPISEDDAACRERLRMEGGVCHALQNTGVKVAKYYGYEPEGSWFLMERVSGDHLLSRLEDKDLQTSIFLGYMENVARMHALDPQDLDLPDNIPIHKDYEDSIHHNFNTYRAPYDTCTFREPEPLIELGLSWMSRHKPKPVSRFSLATGDIGADQFLFENGKFKCMFDLELAYVGDPMQDIGLMRQRNCCYPIADLNSGIRHWAKLMGRELDKESLSYWTIHGSLGCQPMFTYPEWIRPSPKLMVDLTGPVFAANALFRRLIAESLAEYYDIDLSPPEQVSPTVDRLTKYHEALLGQIRDFHMEQATDAATKYALGTSAALAEVNVLCNTVGPEYERQNIAEMASILGYQPTSEFAGLEALETRIKKDPERDLERVLQVLYNVECRTEYLLAPTQHFTGFASGAPLQRMNLASPAPTPRMVQAE